MAKSKRDPEEIEKDREAKKLLVVDTIISYCTSSSPIKDFRTICAALAKGDRLDIEVISGGCTNFSYKCFLRESPDKALFAKLSFPYALWHPDPDVHYDLQRTENEFEIMQHVASSMEDAPIATPYLCVDVNGMKLLVTQWSAADEQWANQFIDGTVDKRIIPKLAETLAILHCSDFDPDFNDNVRPCMLTIFPAIDDTLQKFINEPAETEGRVASLAREYGGRVCKKIINNNLKNYHDRDCLVHSDAHPFNILVEKKPETSFLENFGPKGNFILCDWEMAFAGPIGRDIGLAYCWPVECVLAHSINGHESVAHHIMEILDLLWKEYAAALVRREKNADFLCKTYRNCMAWCGWLLFLGVYMFRCNTEFLPLDETNDDDKAKVLEACGVAGLKLMHWGYGDYEMDLTLEELRKRFKDTVGEEIALLGALAASRRSKARRASVLRASGRRVSDAALHFSLTRNSLASRGSIVEGYLEE